MQTLLIAVRSESLTFALRQKLQNRFVIHSCTTGSIMWSQLDMLQPDILIVDLHLSGAPALPELCSVTRGCAILALTDFADEAVLREAEAAGVAAVMRLPCAARAVADMLDRMADEALALQ